MHALNVLEDFTVLEKRMFTILVLQEPIVLLGQQILLSVQRDIIAQ
jgi:hypothetical protein